MAGMDGLLDFAKTPEGQGLLAAVAGGLTGARRGTPWNNIGRAGVAGLVGYSQAQKNELEFAQKKQMADLTKQMMGEIGGGDGASSSNAQAALEQGAQGGSVGPTVQNATLMDSMPVQPKPSGLSLPTMRKAAILGMKNIEPLFNMYKYEKDGIERKPGTFYRNATTGAEEYINDPTKGFDYDPTTKAVTPIAGYNETIAGQEGAKTRATEGAKAGFNLLPLGYVGQDGRPIGGTVGNYINSLTPQQSPQQAVSPPVPRSVPRLPNQRPEGFPVVTPQQQQGRDTEAYRIISDELKNETNPENQAALRRELSRIRPAGAPVLQSEAEREAAVGRVKMELAVQEDRLKKAPDVEIKRQAAVSKAGEALKTINKALEHPGLGTATGLSGQVDLRNYIAGTDAKDFRVVMDQLGGQTFLQAFESLKGAGQITEVEGKKATDAIGRLSLAQSTEEFKRSLQDLREVVTDGMSRANGVPASDPKPNPAKNMMAELPKPNGGNKGKTAIDHDTGKRYKSNGMQWVEVK